MPTAFRTRSAVGETFVKIHTAIKSKKVFIGILLMYALLLLVTLSKSIGTFKKGPNYRDFFSAGRIQESQVSDIQDFSRIEGL